MQNSQFASANISSSLHLATCSIINYLRFFDILRCKQFPSPDIGESANIKSWCMILPFLFVIQFTSIRGSFFSVANLEILWKCSDLSLITEAVTIASAVNWCFMVEYLLKITPSWAECTHPGMWPFSPEQIPLWKSSTSNDSEALWKVLFPLAQFRIMLQTCLSWRFPIGYIWPFSNLALKPHLLPNPS